MGTNNYDTYHTVNVNSAAAVCFSHAKMQMRVSFSFFLPSFHLKLASLLNSVVSRCPSDGDKENERGLDIISIAMSLLSMPLVRRSHSAGQPLHYLFNLQMTVSPNAILPSIKSRGSWIYKRQSGGWLPPAALLGPIIQAQLSPVSLHFLFSS